MTFSQLAAKAVKLSGRGITISLWQEEAIEGWMWAYKDKNGKIIDSGHTTALTKPVAFSIALSAL